MDEFGVYGRVCTVWIPVDLWLNLVAQQERSLLKLQGMFKQIARIPQPQAIQRVRWFTPQRPAIERSSVNPKGTNSLSDIPLY